MINPNNIGVPAGKDPGRPIPADLDLHYITPDTELPKQQFLFEIGGIPCMPVGEVITFTGKAKQGKTFATSLAMAAALGNGSVMGIKRLTYTPLRVLYIDTEQSKRSTQAVQRRVLTLAGIAPDQYRLELFPTVNLRAIDWQNRLEYIWQYVARHQPHLAVLDGCRDLVDDINNNALSSQVVSDLMRIASYEQQPSCVITVLHQNKSAEDNTLRGHIGTELTNKSFEVYSIHRDDSGLFSIHQECSREIPLRCDVHFTIDNEGLPQECREEEKPVQEVGFRNDHGGYNLQAIFDHIIPRGHTPQARLVQIAVQELLNIPGSQVNRDIITPALKANIIYRMKGSDKHVYYTHEAHPSQSIFPLYRGVENGLGQSAEGDTPETDISNHNPQ